MLLPYKNFKRFLAKFFKQPGYALSIAFKRLRALGYYYFGQGLSSQPESITLFLTYRCNLRCKMCGQWGDYGVTRKSPQERIVKELEFDEYKQIIDQVVFFKPSVTLFGGEPLLHKDFIPLLEYIKSKKMHCLVITNGSLLKQYAGQLVELKLDELNISLDGDKALHEQIRGLPGLFDQIIEGLNAINFYKEKINANQPLINLQCTITQYNYQYLEQLINVAKLVKANSLTFHHLIFLEQDKIARQQLHDQKLANSSKDWQGFVFDPQIDYQKLYQKIIAIKAQAYPFSLDFYPNFSATELKNYYTNPNYAPKEYPARCLSPWLVAYIFCDGSLRPCLNFSYTYGNIKTEAFSRIWNGIKAVSYRKYLKAEKIFPVCARCTELYRY